MLHLQSDIPWVHWHCWLGVRDMWASVTVVYMVGGPVCHTVLPHPTWLDCSQCCRRVLPRHMTDLCVYLSANDIVFSCLLVNCWFTKVICCLMYLQSGSQLMISCCCPCLMIAWWQLIMTHKVCEVCWCVSVVYMMGGPLWLVYMVCVSVV